jgi:hypothetical protein
MTVKRGLIRLWIAIAVVVDLYLAFSLGTSLESGIPLGAPWDRFLLVVGTAHILWFGVLAMGLWVVGGFSSKK